MAQLPRQHGTGIAINPGAVGYSAHLRDDPSFKEVYIDRISGGGATQLLDRRRNSRRIYAYVHPGGRRAASTERIASCDSTDAVGWALSRYVEAHIYAGAGS